MSFPINQNLSKYHLSNSVIMFHQPISIMFHQYLDKPQNISALTILQFSMIFSHIPKEFESQFDSFLMLDILS